MKSNFQKIFLPHREPNHKTQKMCSEIKRHSKVAHKSSSNKVLDDKNFNYFHLFFSGMAFGDGWRVRLGEEKIWNCFREQKITKTHQQTLFHLEKKVKSRFINIFSACTIGMKNLFSWGKKIASHAFLLSTFDGREISRDSKILKFCGSSRLDFSGGQMTEHAAALLTFLWGQ